MREIFKEKHNWAPEPMWACSTCLAIKACQYAHRTNPDALRAKIVRCTVS